MDRLNILRRGTDMERGYPGACNTLLPASLDFLRETVS
jgi:hypothetical protein